MGLRARVLFAPLIAAFTACGLIYDVDTLEKGSDSCGNPDQPCCDGKCHELAECVTKPRPDGGLCPCKDAGSTADAKATNQCPCTVERCQACGNPGVKCCLGKKCGGTLLSCQEDGLCGGCGEPTQACCDTKVSCVKGSECKDGKTCTKKECGQVGQPCCEGGKCDVGSCQSDICKESGACGQLGQDCCTGGQCSAGSCVSGKCTDVPPPCGDTGQSCCTSGAACARTDLVCSGGTTCVSCGNEGQPCCDNPKCVAGSLTCDGSGTCRTCPWGGAACGGSASSVCMGVGGGEQCAACGGLGQPCCSGAVTTPCPGVDYCCNGTGGGCTTCSGWPCYCKGCCVRCGNWAAGNYVRIAAQPDTCPTEGANYCVGKGGKAYAQWGMSCPP